MPKAVGIGFPREMSLWSTWYYVRNTAFKKGSLHEKAGRGVISPENTATCLSATPALHGSALASLQFTPKGDQAGEGGFTPTSSFPARPSSPTPHAAPSIPARAPCRPPPPQASPSPPRRVHRVLAPHPSAPQSSLRPNSSTLSPPRGPAHSIAKVSPPGQTPPAAKAKSADPTSAHAHTPPAKPGLFTSCPRQGPGRLLLRPHRAVNTLAQIRPPRGPGSRVNYGALVPPRGWRRHVTMG